MHPAGPHVDISCVLDALHIVSSQKKEPRDRTIFEFMIFIAFGFKFGGAFVQRFIVTLVDYE